MIFQLLSTVAYLSLITFVSSHYTCTPGVPCTVDCGNYTRYNCSDSIVNGSAATNLNITCPTLSSCHNMTAICPSTNDINKCEITCLDSLSCDDMSIISQSETTILNCITSDIDKTNICTNNVSITLSGNDINMATINCIAKTTTKDEPVIVCDNLILKTDINTTTANNVNSSSLSFHCQGAGINCDSINIDSTNINQLSVYVNALDASISNSTFINNNNVHVEISNNSHISMSSFTGIINSKDSLVDIIISDGGVSDMNNYIFDGVTTFRISTGVNDPHTGLLNKNNIKISNSASQQQTVKLQGINGDNTNVLYAPKCNSFVLECSNNLIDCGNIGSINVVNAVSVNISIGNAVNFSSNINASNAKGLDLKVLDNGVINALVLNATDVGQLDLNIYGKARGTNMIYASNAQRIQLSCHNDKSCSGNLQLYASPKHTTINCIGKSCDMMTLNISTTLDDITFKMTNCSCKDERTTLCINEWDINCAAKQSKIKNTNCTGDSVCCGNIIHNLQEPEPDNYTCPLSTQTKYICQKGHQCAVNCSNPTQYDRKTPFRCSLNGIIDGSMAESLSIYCDKDTATCKGLKVLCPDYVDSKNNFCTFYCNSTDSCSSLDVTTNDNQDVSISCLVDRSCHDIILTGQPPKANNIKVNCTTGLCKNITIYGFGTNVEFECLNGSVCDNINIDNDPGKTVLNLNGTAMTNFVNSSISGQSIIIYGQSYIFKNNTLKVDINGVLRVNGNGMSSFDNNTIIHNNDPNNCNHILSINNAQSHSPTYGIEFTKMNKTLKFNKADYINITTTKNNHQRFIDNDVVIINPNAAVYINNYGILYNNTFNAPQSNLFSLLCNGKCFNDTEGTNFINKLIVNNVTNLHVIIGNNDYISDNNTQIEGHAAHNFYFVINKNGTMTNFNLNKINPNQVTITNNNGRINNISINAKGSKYFTLGCYGSCNNTDVANKYYLEDVKHIELDVGNDVINNDNTQLLNITGAETIYLTSNMNATLSDFQFKNPKTTISTVLLTANAGGILSNIYINATNASLFKLDCGSNGCKNAKTANTFIINGVNNVSFYATNDTINAKNTKIIHDKLNTNISMFNFFANANGEISDILIATQNTESIALICNDESRLNNFNISSNNISSISINNNQGIVNGLIINNPKIINEVNINIIGTLSNSTINVGNANNLSLVCSNVINNGKDIIAGNCKNVSLFTPISPKVNSSLLCQNEGCQNMIFYTQKNIDDIKNITLADCPCDSATKSSCIMKDNRWDIYCKPDSNGNYNNKPSILNDNNKCSGSCCGNVINDLKIKQCDYSGGNKKSKVGAIVGGICAGILCIAMIFAGCYYYKKKKIAEHEALLSVNEVIE